MRWAEHARDSVWVILATAFSTMGQLGALSAVAKVGSATALGDFGLSLSLLGPMVLLAGFGLRSVVARDVAGRYSVATALQLRASAMLVGVLLIAGGVWLNGAGASLLPVVLLLGGVKAGESGAELLQGVMTRRGDFRAIAVYSLARSAIGVASLYVGLRLFGLQSGLSFLLLASWAILIVGELRHVLKHHHVDRRDLAVVRAGELRDLVAHAAPLGMTVALVALVANIPRYVVSTLVGRDAVGILVALSATASVGVVLVSAMSQPAMPSLARAFNASDRRTFVRLCARLVLVAACVGVLCYAGALIGGGLLLSNLFGEAVAKERLAFLLLIVASTLGGLVAAVGVSLTAAGAYAAQLPSLGATAVVTTIASFSLVARFGLSGAAGATIAGAFVQLLLLTRPLLKVIEGLQSAQPRADGAT